MSDMNIIIIPEGNFVIIISEKEIKQKDAFSYLIKQDIPEDIEIFSNYEKNSNLKKEWHFYFYGKNTKFSLDKEGDENFVEITSLIDITFQMALILADDYLKKQNISVQSMGTECFTEGEMQKKNWIVYYKNKE